MVFWWVFCLGTKTDRTVFLFFIDLEKPPTSVCEDVFWVVFFSGFLVFFFFSWNFRWFFFVGFLFLLVLCDLDEEKRRFLVLHWFFYGFWVGFVVV